MDPGLKVGARPSALARTECCPLPKAATFLCEGIFIVLLYTYTFIALDTDILATEQGL